MKIHEFLRQHADQKPQDTAYRYLLDGERKEISITYAQLDRRAKSIAAALKKQVTPTPKSALLIYPSGLEFICAFFGCLYAGIIAVPVPIPKKIRTATRFQKILEDSQTNCILTDKATFAELNEQPFFQTLEISWTITQNLPLVADFYDPVSSQELAFLQYTSGSTSTPKGVMISHANIMANQKMIQQAFGHDANTIFVGWLPLFHDMGLVGNILQPMYLGIPSILLSPVAFLQKPLRWLQAISHYKATTSGAPNFAYDLCIKKITEKEKETLDLSHWKVAFNGAEPIQAQTLIDFHTIFSSCGFHFNSFYPCYGLAEATVFATGNPCGTTPILLTINKNILEKEHRALPVNDSQKSITFVSVGKHWQEGQTVIVDPEKNELCPSHQIGEIWIQGPHIAEGYWNQPAINKTTFHAELNGKGPFLRSGDLGFIDHQGDLFITGRCKDLIIIRGRNIYPQDVEWTVENCHPYLRQHGCAAFSVQKENEESLVVVAEIEREKIRSLNKEEVLSSIRRFLSEEYQLSSSFILLIKPNTLPKTSSGKIQRHLCKTLFLEHKLEEIAGIASIELPTDKESLNPVEKILNEKLAEIIHLPTQEIKREVSWSAYGIDSMGAIAIQVFIHDTWGVVISLEEILDQASIFSVAQKIDATKLQMLIPSPDDARTFNSPFSLSFQQLGIWLDMEISQSSSSYNLARIIEILSPIDPLELKKALFSLMEKYPSLRTIFFLDPEPKQKVLSQWEVPFFEKKLPEKDLDHFFREETLSSFSLDQGPPFRIWLLKTDTSRSLLFILAHHLIADLWSLAILIQELFMGAQNTSISPKNDYAHYVAWQREAFSKDKMHLLVAYWKSKIIQDPFILPTDYARSQTRLFHGNQLPFSIPESLGHDIVEFAIKRATTPFVVLLSAYLLLLYTTGGKRKQCVGITSNGRGEPCWYKSFGMFANPVPFFLALSPYWDFAQLVDEVKLQTSQILGSYQIPFPALLQELQHARDQNQVLLFQSIFVFQQVPILKKTLHSLIIPDPTDNQPVQIGNTLLKPFYWYPPISTFDWTIFMNETEKGFSGYFEYNTDLFKSDTIQSLKDGFIKIIETYIKSPVKIGALSPIQDSIFPTNEKKYKTIGESFIAIAQKCPEQVALFQDSHAITFQSLNALSNKIARWLIRKGVFPDSVVAIMCAHSPELIGCILALLKIGAAFLPIDGKMPKQRIMDILDDSQAIFLVTDEELQSISKLKESDEVLPILADCHSIAYIIYTSGSTGKPKGVAISHASLLNYLTAIQYHYSISKASHFPLYSSLSFDLTLTSLFFPLLFGGSLHLFLQNEDVGITLETIIRHPLITHLKLTPAHLKLLQHQKIDSTHITQLIVGGEQLPLVLADDILKQFPNQIQIVNEYGPTEATIGCMYFIYPSIPLDVPMIPIGSPIQNTYSYLLSDDLQPLSLQREGELYLGGDSLAFGYWNAPRLTAASFLPDPFFDGKRMYKSGDLAKKWSEFIWFYLGRTDRQLKIRGFRIELEEIERHLSKHPHVKQVVITAVQDSLRAYYTHKTALNTQDLQNFLEKTLPPHMIPTLFIPCETIPLTSNGKVDIKALPSFIENVHFPTHQFKSAETLLQKTLLELWEQTLGFSADKIGIKRSFFECGGDSIKAMQLVSKGRTKKIQFTVSELFQYPTIEKLSLFLEKHQQKPTQNLIHNTGSDDQSIHLAPIQSWFFHHFADFPHHFNQAVLLKSPIPFDPFALFQAFSAIVAHHPSLNMRFPNIGDKGSMDSQMVLQLTILDSHETDINHFIDKLQQGLHIHRGPLINVGLVPATDASYCIVVIHHLLVDGVSWRILLEDLDLAYRQLLEKNPIVLPPSTDLYTIWTRFLSNSPTKNACISTEKFSIVDQKTCSFSLTQEDTKTLLFDTSFAYNTQIQDLLLSAVYSTYVKVQPLDSNMHLHVEGHGRDTNQFDLTRTVGWFTTLSSLKLETNELSLPLLIKTVKESLRKPKKEETLHPSILFNYLGQIDTTSYISFTYHPILEGTIDPRAVTPYALQILLVIMDHKLYGYCTFDSVKHSEDFQKKFTSQLEQEVIAIIHHCSHQTSTTYTPSDFEVPFLSLLDWEKIEAVTKNGREIESIWPLFPLQQGLIYQTIQFPHSPAYIEQAVLHLEGNSTMFDWEKALSNLSSSHEALRTSFVYESLQKPVQVIFKQQTIPFHRKKIPDDTDAEKYLELYLQKEQMQGFDIQREALLRVSLVEGKEPRFYLIWTFHHLILDGWSLSLLFRAFLQNLSSVVSSSPSLKGYVEWYKNQHHSSAYWKVLLNDFHLASHLPRMQSSKAISKSTRKIKKILSTNLVDKLHFIAKGYHVTLNALFQAIWSFLLMNYTRQKDLIYGTVLSGRNPEVADMDDMVGLFIATLPLRVKMEPQMTLIEIALNIQNQLTESALNTTTPLADIQTFTPLKQHLIDHLVVFENYPFAGQANSLVKESRIPFKLLQASLVEETHYDFLVSFLPTEEMTMEIHYNPQEYNTAFVENIPSHFEEMLQTVVSDPLITVGQIDLAIQNEKKQIFHVFNHTDDLPQLPHHSLPDLFQKQVQSTPDAVALIFGDHHVTYRELDRRSTHLAIQLIKKGIQREQCVGIYLYRSIEMIISWLAVLKAGAAYIPLDPTYSSHRLSHIAEETSLSMILTSSDLVLQLTFLHTSVIDVSHGCSSYEMTEYDPLNFEWDPLQLAYILYTSGSTGRPKGIAMSHKSVINHLHWISKEFQLDPKDRMLQLTAFTFDVSLCEFYILFKGGTLVLAPPNASQNIEVLLQTIEDHQVTFLQMVPSLLEALLETDILKRLKTVRQVLCGADILKQQHVNKWFSGCSIPLTNLYGLTETCIDSTYFHCHEITDDIPLSIPIGRPLANTQAYILNDTLSLLPSFVVGELYIGGEGLARGYYRQPSLTADRFRPHRYVQGMRMFQTSDLVYWNPQSYLTYIGRSDHQIKLRGFRIELGEIESTLLQHPEIEQSLVKVIDQKGTKALCAYFVATTSLNSSSISDFLHQILPGYMVPAYYVQLQTFPLTAHGKIDTSALPVILINEEIDIPLPQNAIEIEIQKLWKEVLELSDQKIGIDHNFFDLGGNSLTLMQVQYRLERYFNKKIPIQTFFQHPTIRTLATSLVQKNETSLNIKELTIRAQKQAHRKRRR